MAATVAPLLSAAHAAPCVAVALVAVAVVLAVVWHPPALHAAPAVWARWRRRSSLPFYAARALVLMAGSIAATWALFGR